MQKQRIFVAGHRGLVGSAICRELGGNDSVEIITASRDEVDLTNQKQVQTFFQSNAIDQVYLAAANVGGIFANNEYPAEFIYQNLMIEANVIHSAHLSNVQKLLFMGSSCIYPKFAEQPIPESALLTGILEPTNEPYAIAKIAGIKLCESYNRQYGRDYRSVMPTNLYGPYDNFHPKNSHVIPALIQRFHFAKETNALYVDIWGTGQAMREFLHVDDMSSASIFIMNLDSSFYNSKTKKMLSHINIGSGVEYSIKELAEMIAKIVLYDGEIHWDSSKNDGAPKKLMDTSLLSCLGWSASIKLEDGLKKTYEWFLNNIDSF